MSNTNQQGFNYTYSAEQQEEVKKIRQKYIPTKENKMEMLRKLDQSAKQSGRSTSITVGVISSLLMGFGMACIMEWQNLIVIGLLFGIIGMIGMIAAYPIYKSITEKRRKEVMPQIMKLSDELMQGKE